MFRVKYREKIMIFYIFWYVKTNKSKNIFLLIYNTIRVTGPKINLNNLHFHKLLLVQIKSKNLFPSMFVAIYLFWNWHMIYLLKNNE